MELNDYQWANFYKDVGGRQPRLLLMDVLERFDQESSKNPRKAIDLGCGDGTETAFLLAKGWHVLAIDSEPSAFDYLNTKIPPQAHERLQTQIAKFEDVELSAADLIYAGYSLPFCHPQHFEALWNKIVTNINPAGRIAGQLFGVNDTWVSNPNLTFFTAEGARALFAPFEVESFQEEDADGESTLGPKHWHIFHVIARKK
jgi:tellurite methyltransferase